jgi:glutamate 5-kinase
MYRESLIGATRIVVKLGTGILTDSRKRPDEARMKRLVGQLAGQRLAGKQVVVVTSGAVGAGMGALGHDKRPADLAELQACAAIGQSKLMAIYERLFAEHGLTIAQVLLTHDDLQHHERHLNARNTLVTLLARGIVPIINENDAVSFTEIKFGDNDKLSALLACLLPADLLVILTTVDGVIENFGEPGARVISVIEEIDGRIEAMAGGTNSATAVGGMTSKIQAAKIAGRAGIPLLIASGEKKNALANIVAGADEGTLFVPKANKLKGRKRWIAFFHTAPGAIYVDDGCRTALREKGRSLLAPGILRREGTFAAGEVVRVCDKNGTEFARGIARFGADAVGPRLAPEPEVINRNDLVLL